MQFAPVIAAAALSAIQSEAAASSQAKAQQAAANRQIEQQQMQQQLREKQLREQAKQEQATARARFGARGVSSTGGSADSLLSGITSRTEQAIADQNQLLDFSIQSLRENSRKPSTNPLLGIGNSLLNSAIKSAGAPTPQGLPTSVGFVDWT
ncbi:MAG: hypothetical protein O2944_09230 [Proteobacteria bacterium]|nr:hypothetical protein [Pseudomonadota bacterium]